ncbi:MAG: hypothetical protein ACEQSK_09280, partial [Sphingomonadaceae bacterium]
MMATGVRNLAQRSAAAAKEIKELIVDSVEKVEAGRRPRRSSPCGWHWRGQRPSAAPARPLTTLGKSFNIA